MRTHHAPQDRTSLTWLILAAENKKIHAPIWHHDAGLQGEHQQKEKVPEQNISFADSAHV